MNIDFDKVKDQQVGYDFILNRRDNPGEVGEAKLREISFSSLIASYCESRSARWEVYNGLREDLNEISESQSRISKQGKPKDLEILLTLALRIGSISRAMSLIAETYLSRGLIHNEPLPEKRL
ncbi:MAG: hypothetical protein AABX10_04220 [Nanoarchaeota archaeon]